MQNVKKRRSRRHHRIVLSCGTAELIVPSSITQADANKLKGLVDALVVPDRVEPDTMALPFELKA